MTRIMKATPFVWTCILLALLHTAHSQNKPPDVQHPIKPKIEYLRSEENFTVTCKAKGIPQPRYRWTRNNGNVPSTFTVDEITGVLTIKDFSAREEGDYQCLAENEVSKGTVAVAMSAVISLKKAKLGSKWVTKGPNKVSATKGDYLQLTCDNSDSSVPRPTYSWHLNAGDTSEGDVKNSERKHTDAEGTLHFIQVREEDESEALFYKCGLYNSVLDAIQLGGDRSLVVNDVTGAIPASKPQIRYYTKDSKFLRTQEATLECVFSGNDIPSITWYDKQNDEITSNDKYQLKHRNRMLIVHDLKEGDEGMYRCKGQNARGEDEQKVFLDVTSGPIWEDSLKSQTVPEDKYAVFTCKARSADGEKKPDPPKWFKNGMSLPVKNDTKYEWSNDKRVLTVKNLNKTTDIMCFQCKVNNEIGYEFADGCLNVIKPIVVTRRPKRVQRISKGDMVDLTIVAETDPAYTLKYRWNFREKMYDGPEGPGGPMILPFAVYDSITNETYINTTDLSDEDYMKINGTYYMILSHDDDSRTVSVNVVLEELPNPAAVAGLSDQLWWIAVIAAAAILVIVTLLVMSAHGVNRKKQRGVYLLDKRERENDLDPEKDIHDGRFHPLATGSSGEAKMLLASNVKVGDDEHDISGENPNAFKSDEDGSFMGMYKDT